MTDAAEVIRDTPHGRDWDADSPGLILDGLLSLAPEVYPRRVVLEQESEGAPVVVRLLVRSHNPYPLFRLSDVPEENQ